MRVIVEITSLGRPGRGLGRYTRAVLEGASSAGFNVIRLAVRKRTGRTAEFRDLLERQALGYGAAMMSFTPRTHTSQLSVLWLAVW